MAVWPLLRVPRVFGDDYLSPLATIRIPYRSIQTSMALSFVVRADFAVSSR
jgi:hypothetical protein